MEVAIIGAGALGSVYGAYFQASGVNVHLLDVWEDHIVAISENGLRIERDSEVDLVVEPHATTQPGDIGTVDVAFVLVKATQTREAMRGAEPIIGEETTVVTVQNGLNNVDVVGEFVPSRRIVGGSSMISAELIGPGRVHLISVGETNVGAETGARPQAIARLISEAGLPATTVEDPRKAIWSKQLVNVAVKPLAALTELQNGGLVASDELVALMEGLLLETVSVAEAAGIALDAEDPLETTIEACERGPEKRSSMLVDVQAGRRTEIDHINGAVVEYGRRYGVPTPYNETVTALVRGKQASYLDG